MIFLKKSTTGLKLKLSTSASSVLFNGDWTLRCKTLPLSYPSAQSGLECRIFLLQPPEKLRLQPVNPALLFQTGSHLVIFLGTFCLFEMSPCVGLSASASRVPSGLYLGKSRDILLSFCHLFVLFLAVGKIKWLDWVLSLFLFHYNPVFSFLSKHMKFTM